MKLLVLFSVLVGSSSAMAMTSTDVITQATQKVSLAQQQVQAIEDGMPAAALFAVKANLETLKMHLDAVQQDLGTLLSPSPTPKP